MNADEIRRLYSVRRTDAENAALDEYFNRKRREELEERIRNLPHPVINLNKLDNYFSKENPPTIELMILRNKKNNKNLLSFVIDENPPTIKLMIQ